MSTLKTGKTKTEENTGGGTIWENKFLLPCSILKNISTLFGSLIFLMNNTGKKSLSVLTANFCFS